MGMLTAYKQYYEQFRHVEEVVPNLPIKREAALSGDYADARTAFNEWLQFVTDTIQQQSYLEPELDDPTFKRDTRAEAKTAYRERTDHLDAALARFNRDLQTDVPRATEFQANLTPYQLGHRLVNVFSNLTQDTATMLGQELLLSHSWEKQ